MAATPPFDFNDFSNQLSKAVTAALKKGFKDLGSLGIGKSIKDSIAAADLDDLLGDLGVKSTKALKAELKNIQDIRRAGGVEAMKLVKEEEMLRAMWLKANGNLSEEEIQRRLANHKIQKQTLDLEQRRLSYQEQISAKAKEQEERLKNIRAILTDPKLAKTFLAAEGLKAIQQGFKSLRGDFDYFRERGQTFTQSATSTFQSLTAESIIFGVKTKEALGGMQDALGDLGAVSADSANEMAKLALVTGVNAETAGKLAGSLQQMPGQTAATSVETAKFAGNLARAAKVAPGKVLETMANSTEEIAKFSADGGKNFAKAAVGAAKMGVEVNKLASAAEALLDFENSINKQVEASVLLGREINFDKARELALQGDLVGATQNMLSQLGGEAEFNKMNLLQKKALAESMGMSVTDLGKLVKNQDKFNEAQKEALANGSSLDEVLAMGEGSLKKWGGYLTADNLTAFFTGVSALKGMGGIFSSMTGMFSKFKGMGGGGAISQTTGSISKINTGSMLKGAAAMAVASASIYIFAKAIQELEKIKDWTNVAIGLGAFAASMGLIGAVGSFASAGLEALAVGLTAFGTAMMGPGGLGLIALTGAAIGLGFALNLAAPGIEAFGKVITAVFDGIAKVLPVIVDGFVNIFEVLAANWQILIPVGVGMMFMAGGVALLGLAGVSSFAGLMLLSVGLVAVGGASMILAAGLNPLVSGLTQLAVVAPQLGLVAVSLMGIASGLGAMALAGLAAIPIIGALSGLAILAPALGGLADVFGGGGGAKQPETKTEEKSSNDTALKAVAQKLDTLISIISKPAAITMDGKKVGDAIRIAYGSIQ